MLIANPLEFTFQVDGDVMADRGRWNVVKSDIAMGFGVDLCKTEIDR